MRGQAVVVHDGPWYAVAVLPAGVRLNLDRLRHVTRRWDLRLADEAETAALFPGGSVVPWPFGRRYGLDLYLDRTLLEDPELVVERGTGEPVRVAMDEYLMTERPAVVDLSTAA